MKAASHVPSGVSIEMSVSVTASAASALPAVAATPVATERATKSRRESLPSVVAAGPSLLGLLMVDRIVM